MNSSYSTNNNNNDDEKLFSNNQQTNDENAEFKNETPPFLQIFGVDSIDNLIYDFLYGMRVYTNQSRLSITNGRIPAHDRNVIAFNRFMTGRRTNMTWRHRSQYRTVRLRMERLRLQQQFTRFRKIFELLKNSSMTNITIHIKQTQIRQWKLWIIIKYSTHDLHIGNFLFNTHTSSFWLRTPQVTVDFLIETTQLFLRENNIRLNLNNIDVAHHYLIGGIRLQSIAHYG